MSPRWNWDPPSPLSRKRVCPSTGTRGGGGTLACGWGGGGVPIPTIGEKAYSAYSVLPTLAVPASLSTLLPKISLLFASSIICISCEVVGWRTISSEDMGSTFCWLCHSPVECHYSKQMRQIRGYVCNTKIARKFRNSWDNSSSCTDKKENQIFLILQSPIWERAS